MSYTDPDDYKQAPVVESAKPERVTRPEPEYNYSIGFGLMFLLWGACLIAYAAFGGVIWRLAVQWIVIIHIGFLLILLGIMTLAVGLSGK